MSGEGVEVVPEAAGEEDGVLGDDGDGGAERGQAHLQYSTVQYSTVQRGQAHPGDVHPVYGDGAGGGLDDAEEGEGDGGLARPRPAHDAHLLPRLEVAAHIPQHQVQTSPVPGATYYASCYYTTFLCPVATKVFHLPRSQKGFPFGCQGLTFSHQAFCFIHKVLILLSKYNHADLLKIKVSHNEEPRTCGSVGTLIVPLIVLDAYLVL